MNASLRPPLLFAWMLTGATLAAVLKPTVLLAEQVQGVDLERMIPAHFDNWAMIPTNRAQVVDPGQQALIQAIYTQTLTRVYRNENGYMVMLSISYGKDQRDALQVHRPEICYPAQGFSLLDKQQSRLAGRKEIPVMHMQTQLGSRFEPVTYWTMIGDQPYAGGLTKKLIEIRYGLAGTIPDGMLVRISSIDVDTADAYKKQESFALAMIEALPSAVRPRFSGH